MHLDQLQPPTMTTCKYANRMYTYITGDIIVYCFHLRDMIWSHTFGIIFMQLLSYWLEIIGFNVLSVEPAPCMESLAAK